VNTAVGLGAKFVSNSYGGSESSSDTSYDTSYFNHPGVAITVSSGDSGYGVEYPAASKYVTAVGGTSLSKASNTRGWTESAWSTSSREGAGSGCSAYDAKPTWQTDTGCTRRTVADVSAVADPATGVAVYQTYGANGWTVYGGTSVASPLIAAVGSGFRRPLSKAVRAAPNPCRSDEPYQVAPLGSLAWHPFRRPQFSSPHRPRRFRPTTSRDEFSARSALRAATGPIYGGPDAMISTAPTLRTLR
jgi:hypothetical protein